MRASRTALVIENDRVTRDGIDAVLREQGSAALIAPDMNAALRAFLGADPDAVFLRVAPTAADESETGVARAAKTWSAAPLVAVCDLGGAAGEAILAAARRDGARLILREPHSRKAITAAYEDAASLKLTGARRPRALVVDDSSTIRKIVRSYLEPARWRVFEAPDMESAIETLPIVEADVVITDIFMPGIGGIEGIRRLRERWPTIGIVATSGGLDERMGSDGALAAAERIGADRVVAKPFNAETLLEAARAASRAPISRAGAAAA